MYIIRPCLLLFLDLHGCCCIQSDFKNCSPNQNGLSEARPYLLNFPGPEYGTTEAAWKAVLVEADRRCELHIKVKDNLLNEVSLIIGFELASYYYLSRL